MDKFGLKVKDHDGHVVVVSTERSSQAAEGGVKKGWVVKSVGGKAVSSVSEVDKFVGNDEAVAIVFSLDSGHTITLTLSRPRSLLDNVFRIFSNGQEASPTRPKSPSVLEKLFSPQTPKSAQKGEQAEQAVEGSGRKDSNSLLQVFSSPFVAIKEVFGDATASTNVTPKSRDRVNVTPKSRDGVNVTPKSRDGVRESSEASLATKTSSKVSIPASEAKPLDEATARIEAAVDVAAAAEQVEEPLALASEGDESGDVGGAVD
jgi:hypothetical protein